MTKKHYLSAGFTIAIFFILLSIGTTPAAISATLLKPLAPTIRVEQGPFCGTTKITLNFAVREDGSRTTEGFKIYRSKYGESNFTLIGTVSNTSNAVFNDSTPVPGRYDYQVNSYNSAGESKNAAEKTFNNKPSNCVTKNDNPPPATIATPSMPTVSYSSGSCGNDIIVKWNAVANITNYDIYRQNTLDGKIDIISNFKGTTYTDPFASQSPNGMFTYAVVALNGSLKSQSSPASAIILRAKECVTTTPLAPPTNIKAATSDLCGAKVRVTWNTAPNATLYNVYKSKTATGTYTKLYNGYSQTDFIDADETNTATTTYYYKISSVNDTGESSLSASVSALSSMICPPPPPAPTDPNSASAPKTYPYYSLFNVKSYGTKEFVAQYHPTKPNAAYPEYLAYSLDPVDSQNYYKILGCGNYFCDKDNKFAYIYFPKIMPGDASDFDTLLIQVRLSTGELKDIYAYRPKNLAPSDAHQFPDGIRNLMLGDLPLVYANSIPSYETQVPMSIDTAMRLLRLQSSTLNGHLDVFSQAYHTPKTAAEIAAVQLSGKMLSSEIKVGFIDFTNATSKNLFFSNSTETASTKGSSGVKVTEIGCNGITNNDDTFQMSFLTFLGNSNVMNAGTNQVTAGLEAADYGSAIARGNCNSLSTYYDANSSSNSGNYSYFGSINPANFKTPVKSFTVTVQDVDNSVLGKIQFYTEGDTASPGGNYRTAGDLTLKLSSFDTYGGMFTPDGKLGVDPKYTLSVTEANYPLLAQTAWYQQSFTKALMAIKYSKLTASVLGAFKNFAAVLVSQTPTKDETTKKDPSKIARNAIGNTPLITLQDPVTPDSPTAVTEMVRAEYITRDLFARFFAATGQKDRPVTEKKPCASVESKDCLLLSGLDPSFIFGLMSLRMKYPDGISHDIIITGGTEYWLHGNMNQDREKNDTAHGYSRTIDISTANLFDADIETDILSDDDQNNAANQKIQDTYITPCKAKSDTVFYGVSPSKNSDPMFFYVEGDTTKPGSVLHVEDYPKTDYCNFDNRKNFDYPKYPLNFKQWVWPK